MPNEQYVIKLLREDDGEGIYFDSWGAGLTSRFESARVFNRDFQAIEVMDAWNEEYPDRGLFLCRQSEAKKA